jgi:hypothetical protein
VWQVNGGGRKSLFAVDSQHVAAAIFSHVQFRIQGDLCRTDEYLTN